MWVVIFPPRPLYPRGKRPGTHWTGGWVGPRARLDAAEKTKFLPLPGLAFRPLSRPNRCQSLYRLRYPGSHSCCIIAIINITHYKQSCVCNICQRYIELIRVRSVYLLSACQIQFRRGTSIRILPPADLFYLTSQSVSTPLDLRVIVV
jgi:hypothetical protein